MPKNIKLRPHPDSEWCDRFLLESPGLDYKFGIYIKERYKTSELSGNVWRFSAVCYVEENKKTIIEESYTSLKTAFLFFPRLILDSRLNADKILGKKMKGTWYFKNQELYSERYDHIIQALLVLPGKFSEIIEGYPMAIEKSFKVQQKLCTQPGCLERPVSIFKVNDCYSHGRKEKPPTPVYRQFCKKHLIRGNADFEDCDDNYTLVSGMSPENTTVDPAVISKSAVVVVDGRDFLGV